MSVSVCVRDVRRAEFGYNAVMWLTRLVKNEC